MRKFILALVASVALTVGVAAAPAMATGSVTIPGGCLLGPSQWDINMSTTYKNTSGSPARGTLFSARVTSPHRVYVGAQGYQPNGATPLLAFVDHTQWTETYSSGSSRWLYTFTYPGGGVANISKNDITVNPAPGDSISTCHDVLFATA